MKIIKTCGLLALLIISLVFPLLFPNPAVTSMAIFSLLFACAATGWNIFSGYTGYISLGYGTYYGLGAYTLGLLSKSWGIQGGYPPFLLLPLTGVIVAACAIPIGWVSLRVRGHNFVVITIATIFIFQLLAYNLSALTDGNNGLLLPIPPWTANFYNLPFYYVSLALLLLAIGVSWWIRHSKYGLSLLAIRDDEERARGLGVKIDLYKLVAFVISAFFGGMVGAMVIYFIGSIYPASAFDPTFDILPALMTFLGGAGTLAGPVFGALLLEPLQQYLILQMGSIGIDLILFGSLLLLLIFTLPDGVIPALQGMWQKWLSSRTTGLPIPSVREKEEILLLEGEGGGKG
jgi:branched-chain amino acid transport system permease protein